jgi:hypothetical protein
MNEWLMNDLFIEDRAPPFRHNIRRRRIRDSACPDLANPNPERAARSKRSRYCSAQDINCIAACEDLALIAYRKARRAAAGGG